MECYIDMPRSSLTRTKTDTGWLGRVNFDAVISRDTVLLASDRWSLSDIAADTADIRPNQRIVESRVFHLAPGVYKIQVFAQDSISGQVWRDEKTVEAVEFKSDGLSVSDIELAGVLLEEGSASKFDRAGFGLLPNPRKLFGPPKDYFYYYLEVYPPQGESADRRYEIQSFILGGAQDTVCRFETSERQGGHSAFAEADSVSLAGLSGGSYTFVVSVKDDLDATIKAQTKFFIYNPTIAPVQPQPKLDSLAILNELAEIDFLLTGGQRKMLKKMKPADQTRFLDEYWKRYDDDPTTPEVPTRRDFRQRVKEADNVWSTYRQEGHKTDRGRIYILYGKPSLKEAFALEAGAWPHEIWTYDNVEGGVIFVFVERTGLGEYELVHSTKSGEINKVNWFDLYVNRSSPGAR
ncbi:MAG: GWxTD domain-containing protein [Calditrichota bacterium]